MKKICFHIDIAVRKRKDILTSIKAITKIHFVTKQHLSQNFLKVYCNVEYQIINIMENFLLYLTL